MAHPEYVDKGKSNPTPEQVQENGLSSNSLALLQFIYHLYPNHHHHHHPQEVRVLWWSLMKYKVHAIRPFAKLNSLHHPHLFEVILKVKWAFLILWHKIRHPLRWNLPRKITLGLMWKVELKIFKEIARKLFLQRLRWLFKQMRFFYPPPHNNNINPKIITPVFIYVVVEKGTEDVKLFRRYPLQSLDIPLLLIPKDANDMMVARREDGVGEYLKTVLFIISSSLHQRRLLYFIPSLAQLF